MRAIYEPKGRAAEYSLLAINLYTGCLHGCTYCYCPDILHITREQFSDPARIAPRKNIRSLIRKEAPRFCGINKRVLLSFMTDPYQPIEAECHITRRTLEILRNNDIPFQILTKAGNLAQRDFHLYRPGIDLFATTLTILDEKRFRQYEPFAAPPAERIENLKAAKERGINTWVSLEPVIDPEETLKIIQETYAFVDHYKVGILNHIANDTDWLEFGIRSVALLESIEKSYYIKIDLAKYLEKAGIKFRRDETRLVKNRKEQKNGNKIPN